MASLTSAFVSANAMLLRLVTWRRPPAPLLADSKARIVCLTLGGVSEMIDTLSLFHGLRRHYPRALIAVACSSEVAPIAQACKAVNVVVIYRKSFIPWLGMLKNAMRLRHFDWVLAAAPGFDLRLAMLARLSNVRMRLGFERRGGGSSYYTDPVMTPKDACDEHRIETVMRLLKPLGLLNPTGWGIDLSLRPPASADEFAEEIRSEKPFTGYNAFVLINLTKTFQSKFREEDFIALASRILGSTGFVVGLMAAPAEVQIAREIAMCMGSDRITVLESMSPIELVALLKHAAFLVTPQGDAAHLAAAMGTSTLVLWFKGSFEKTRSRGRNQFFYHGEPGERTLSVERVWQAMQPLIAAKKDVVEKRWENLLELPPQTDFMP